MRRSKPSATMRIEENYIFYACLILVLTIAAFGIATDIIARH